MVGIFIKAVVADQPCEQQCEQSLCNQLLIMCVVVFSRDIEPHSRMRYDSESPIHYRTGVGVDLLLLPELFVNSQ